ncbi:MAG: GLPGLI family protein [Bacteroidales bacterium]|jgi:GLPGLI family protein|nr:GLPGLI family protein [Bacteroidales bacterium]
MKKLILLIAAFLITIFCFSQENGVINYAVSRDYTKMMATCDFLSKAERERQAYTWGGRTYDQKAELTFNSTEYRFEYIDERAGQSYQWRKEDYIIYRDRENAETFDILSMLDKQYLIQDSLFCQNWKIKNDMKEIAEHICMNATYYDSIKGKEVVAWFALDLPVPLGPNKYCGLPGMILEINEANGALVYTATNVLLSEEKIVIEKPEVKKSRKVITAKLYDKIVLDYINECKKMQRPYFFGISF